MLKLKLRDRHADMQTPDRYPVAELSCSIVATMHGTNLRARPNNTVKQLSVILKYMHSCILYRDSCMIKNAWVTILTAKIGVIGHPHSTLIVIFCHGNLSSTAGSMSVWLITIVCGRSGVTITLCKVPTSSGILKTKIRRRRYFSMLSNYY